MPRSCPVPWLLTAVILTVLAAPATAKVVVVTNATDQSVSFALRHGGDPKSESLAPFETRAFPAGKQTELLVTLASGPARYRLDPFAAYAFTRGKEGLGFQGIEMAGAMPKPDDIPDVLPANEKPLRLPVMILVDDSDPRVRAVWEKAARDRVAAASAVFERQCGVVLDVVAAEEWRSDPTAEGMHALLRDFALKVKPKPAAVAVGFTSHPNAAKTDDAKATVLGCGHGPLSAHVLLREGFPKTEPEQVEVLVHELAHVLGAAHSPDPISAARPQLNDGRAASARFQIGLDPLNLLAVCVWADEMRKGKIQSWNDLSPAGRVRLRVVYQSLRDVMPDDIVAAEYVRILEDLAAPAVAARQPAGGDEEFQPAPRRPDVVPIPIEKILSPKQEAVRKVVRAVAVRARELNGHGTAVPAPRGDALTAEYIQVAADVAALEPDELRASAFLLGIGIALDDSTVLRDNQFTKEMCKAAESDAERQERLAVLGTPTVRHRRDLCQHFVVSAALTEVAGPTIARTLGVAKELLDTDRASGFSFADLAADLAGVAFASAVRQSPGKLHTLRRTFAVEDYVPDVAGLREGLSAKRFEDDFGSSTDPRFENAMAEVRARVEGLPVYRK